MLNIYYGRESVDKEKFIYEEIAGRGFSAASPVIVLVPDQYTLEAERQAFRILEKKALIGLDVYSISRLGHNILTKEGRSNVRFIDKYGRQMLLTKILSGLKDELAVYAGNTGKASFIEMVNDYISSLKQYDVTPEMLHELADGLGGSDALSLKMKDLCMIYSAYDDAIRGKYTDSEDYVDLFISKADRSEMLGKAAVWVYGFDSFASKSMKVLGCLMRLCREVNVVLTYDNNTTDESLFDLTETVMDNLRKTAQENGAEIGQTAAITGKTKDGRYVMQGKAEEIRHLEHELFAAAPHVMNKPADTDHQAVMITEAANYYNEAESCASFILHLIRDKGYRYRDIAVICNDREDLGAALEHAFDEYGIPCFLDKKRNISGSGAAAYISAIITAAVRGMRTQDIFRALKTGLGVLSQDETERLENYAFCYKIDTYRWEKPFTYGKDSCEADEFAELETSRQKVVSLFGKLKSVLKKKQTYSEFLENFYGFLTEDAKLTDKLEMIMQAQKAAGLRDLAEETSQIWHMIVSILDQINNILGDEAFDAEEFLQIFTVGLKQAEIGIMPPSPDDLMIGTMQRTRVGRIKALVVVGVNDGVIPQGGSQSGLFAEQEEGTLAEHGLEACKSEQVRRQEERLAIYRNFCRPESELWISYTAADSSGAQLRPSELIEDVRRIFPYKTLQRDILNKDDACSLISGKTSTLRHMTDAFVRQKNGAVLDPVWNAVLGWYGKHEPDIAARISEGLGFVNRADAIGTDLSDILFSGRGHDLLSPSRLEGYARCPFAYFVNFGLKPEERRVFEAGSREIGDVYHESLMHIASELSEHDLWDTVTREEIADMVRKTLAEERKEYGAGVFGYTGNDRYRADRAEQTIRDAVNVLVDHARAAKIRYSKYEEGFGRYSDIKPITVEEGGRKIYIEGKIDRLDILENGRVRITDYKSGQQTFSEDTIRAGYSLQLMLYMKAAREETRKAAGVFYFYLGTSSVDASKAKDISVEGGNDPDALRSSRDASMRGILVNDPETVSEVLGEDVDAKIASIRRKKSGELSASRGSMVMAEGDFDDLQSAVDDKINELVEGISEGRIDIQPMRKRKENLACRYCALHGVCRFDTAFDGCGFRFID